MKVYTKRKKKITDSSSSTSSSSQTSDADLHTAAVKIAVAQICNSVGYKGAQTSALETLTAVAVRYLQSLAKSAVTSASSSGRTQCNLLDIIRALEDLHSTTGFNGNSNPNRRLFRLSDSSILRDAMKFVYRIREIPFAKPLPRRPHALPPNLTCSFEKSVGLNHIPRWLPAFPKVGEKEKQVVVEPIEEESESESMIKAKLPERRKKVRFSIGGGRKVIDVKSEVDLRIGMCKRGKKEFHAKCMMKTL